MTRVRRLVLAIVFCAAPLLAAPPALSAEMDERVALREVLRTQVRAAAGEPPRLPLGSLPRASAASVVPRATGSERILVGVRSHADLPGVRAVLERLGARPEAFDSIGVLAARVPSAAAAVDALRGDPRVAYVERDGELSVASPFNAVDPSTGVSYTWAFDAVQAGPAIAAAGGGSRREVAVIDTGVDVGHPDLTGRIARSFNTLDRGSDVRDAVGHGTFVAGLISGIDGNGIGTRGVAGATPLFAVKASGDGSFRVADLLRAIEFSLRRRADVINLSLAGASIDRSQARALEAAFFADVLPVAAAGNNAQNGNPLEYPGAAVGGFRGGRGIGLSVGATRPDGQIGAFSNHNSFVSVAAPGASGGNPCFGVFSTIPTPSSIWDDPSESCSPVFDASGRYSYAEGTSFAAPIVAGIASLAWQVQPRLASEQVADVVARSATQTRGSGWNEFTGTGVVNGAAAVAEAARYDVRAPKPRAAARRSGGRVAVRVRRTRDRADSGDQLAGGVRYALLVSRDGGRRFGFAVRPRSRPFGRSVALRGRRANVFVATACDSNGNCGVKRLGRFRP
jgi:subtilisin family serine protease